MKPLPVFVENCALIHRSVLSLHCCVTSCRTFEPNGTPIMSDWLKCPNREGTILPAVTVMATMLSRA